jgi:hypothetical protein
MLAIASDRKPAVPHPARTNVQPVSPKATKEALDAIARYRASKTRQVGDESERRYIEDNGY